MQHFATFHDARAFRGADRASFPQTCTTVAMEIGSLDPVSSAGNYSKLTGAKRREWMGMGEWDDYY